ncbi:MAG: peptidyl-prolyl cis-trans isomerase [Gemmatimonadetes bacterium]|nr:peptidyl-prolyl cis-trans isomerase [Gemmatimonadota bacterium]
MRSAAKYIWIFIFIAFVGGFLLAETSGLLGRAPVTTSTIVATVNGEDIPYLVWSNTSAALAQQQEQQMGRGLTMDERAEVDQRAFDQLVNDVLLRQEYEKRGIRVTDNEVVETAQFAPPPQFRENPEFMTEGQFDMAKYRRFLASPAARQQGILAQLEQYYRTEIPKEKLFTQVASDAYVSDARLWQMYQDRNDSVAVSFISWVPSDVDDYAAKVTDTELQQYYAAHASEFDRPGRAVLSMMSIPRTPTAADSAASLQQAQALRDEIAKGAKFEDVARRASDDSVSGAMGGDLGKGGKGRFVKEFDDAAYKLAPGQVSAPVRTAFGWHIIKVDSRKGDTLSLRHILVKVKQSDSSAVKTDRQADELARLAAGALEPAKFDSAAKQMGLLVTQIEVTEGQQARYLNQVAPSVSAWAFGGTHVGETSDLFDGDNMYYLARLDSLRQGGPQPLDVVKADVRERVATKKSLDAKLDAAKSVAQAAAATSLEAAAKAAARSVQTAPLFTRVGFVVGMGQLNEAVGASFALPVGAISMPVRTDAGIFVIRVDKKVAADRAAFESQKATQRQQAINAMRDSRVQSFVASLRKDAKIDDRRKKVQASLRRQS